MAELIEERALVRPVSRKLRLDLLTQRIVLVAVFIGVWWLASLSVPHYILPGPARVWEALQLIARNGDLWSNLGITFWRVTVGFVFATLVGLPFGIVLGANKRAGDFFEPRESFVARPGAENERLRHAEPRADSGENPSHRRHANEREAVVLHLSAKHLARPRRTLPTVIERRRL